MNLIIPLFFISTFVGLVLGMAWTAQKEIEELTAWLDLIGTSAKTGCLETLSSVREHLKTKKFIFHDKKRIECLRFCENLIEIIQKTNKLKSKKNET